MLKHIAVVDLVAVALGLRAASRRRGGRRRRGHVELVPAVHLVRLDLHRDRQALRRAAAVRRRRRAHAAQPRRLQRGLPTVRARGVGIGHSGVVLPVGVRQGRRHRRVVADVPAVDRARGDGIAALRPRSSKRAGAGRPRRCSCPIGRSRTWAPSGSCSSPSASTVPDTALLTGWGRTAPTAATVVPAAGLGAALADSAAPRCPRPRPRAVLRRRRPERRRHRGRHDGGTVPAPTIDTATGIVTASGATTFDELLRVLVPRGWFVPVTPGTRHVTVGGAVAADMHGKNHHAAGSWMNHVVALDLALPGGEVRTLGPTDDSVLGDGRGHGAHRRGDGVLVPGAAGGDEPAAGRHQPAAPSRCRPVGDGGEPGAATRWPGSTHRPRAAAGPGRGDHRRAHAPGRRRGRRSAGLPAPLGPRPRRP